MRTAAHPYQLFRAVLSLASIPSWQLDKYGHIYCYRLRPVDYQMRAHNIDEYPAQCRQAACIMLMIQNNLDSSVAQYPHELVTYGGNGSVRTVGTAGTALSPHGTT